MKGYLILGVLLVFIVWMFWKAIEAGKTPKIEHPSYTVGTLIKIERRAKGSNSILQYNVNNQIYVVTAGHCANKLNIIGEKYKIKYDKLEPSKGIVLEEQPVFLKDEKTLVIQGKVKRISLVSQKGKKELIFTFEINDTQFSRSQSIEKDYKEQYPDLKEGRSYEVEYWEQNPERAIIHLDKPIK